MTTSSMSRFRTVLAELNQVEGGLADEEIEALIEALLDAQSIYVTGGGRSGLVARAVAMRLMHIGLSVHVVGETATPGITTGDLLWYFSGSGSGAGLMAQVVGARQLGASTVAFMANVDT